MPDINDIRREIDRLFQLNKAACDSLLDDKPLDPHVLVAGQFVANSIQAAINTHWPTISAALAEAEEMRRKARAWDAMRDGAYMQREEGGWVVRLRGSTKSHKLPDLVDAFSVALNSKDEP